MGFSIPAGVLYFIFSFLFHKNDVHIIDDRSRQILSIICRLNEKLLSMIYVFFSYRIIVTIFQLFPTFDEEREK